MGLVAIKVFFFSPFRGAGLFSLVGVYLGLHYPILELALLNVHFSMRAVFCTASVMIKVQLLLVTSGVSSI